MGFRVRGGKGLRSRVGVWGSCFLELGSDVGNKGKISFEDIDFNLTVKVAEGVDIPAPASLEHPTFFDAGAQRLLCGCIVHGCVVYGCVGVWAHGLFRCMGVGVWVI